ncbi:hypothetical protein BJY17_000261 [Agromyces hippuratus]|jgi:hypothetical protein|uniref:Uncharacterized protein n=3 Tax=Agromyces TaxID=33877 RepID=A0A852WWU6_9MICO|nr:MULTISPECIES: hypothetical protein [Agromyces]KQZ07393.1 hypothetical protein ASD23_16075 [Agromyces sp. Root1464]NYG19514.1 hypothetical protein [Agromyces hippuratus]RXZ46396.1 hypothetical protein ESP57_15925 [Agromyces fucosus]SIO16403.1 hypothetical protein SAMN05443544_3002 [Agromyces cerinus subsp. cerinus]
MTTLLSPDSGLLSGWAVRSGLSLASWGLQRAARRNDRDRLQRRIDARATAEAALAERDALHRSAGFLPM